jgi:hypothetical protein
MIVVTIEAWNSRLHKVAIFRSHCNKNLAAARMKAAAFSTQAPVGSSDTKCYKRKKMFAAKMIIHSLIESD